MKTKTMCKENLIEVLKWDEEIGTWDKEMLTVDEVIMRIKETKLELKYLISLINK